MFIAVGVCCVFDCGLFCSCVSRLGYFIVVFVWFIRRWLFCRSGCVVLLVCRSFVCVVVFVGFVGVVLCNLSYRSSCVVCVVIVCVVWLY